MGAATLDRSLRRARVFDQLRLKKVSLVCPRIASDQAGHSDRRNEKSLHELALL
jgi:hypothetical protein